MLSISTSAGFDTVTVTLAGDPASQIRYTLDGAEPVAASMLYSGPFTLHTNATVKARSFKTGLRESLTASAAYKVISSATPSASLEFLGVDASRGGTWKGVYGSQGHIVIADSASLPAYATVTPQGHSQWIWEYITPNTRALQRAATNTRLAPCWYSPTSFDLDVNFTGTTPRILSLYCLDWDFGSRAQTIDIIDFDTGRLLHSHPLSNFSAGIYARYRLQGRVLVRFTRDHSYNAVLSGIFFDP